MTGSAESLPTLPSALPAASGSHSSKALRVDRLGFFSKWGSLQGAPLTRTDFLVFSIIVIVALLLRVVYLFQIAKCPLFDSPVLDAEAHDQWARMIRAGVPAFPGTAYFKAPLYPYLLALLRILLGDDYWAPRYAQIVLGSVSCGLVYLTAREAFNRAVGVVAGFAAAFYWVMIYFDAELLLEPLSVFLTMVSLWLLLRAARATELRLWIVSGLFMGLSAINRPNVLAFIPIVALWILWIHRGQVRRGFARAVAWCIVCAVPIAPVTIRNYMVGHDRVLIASQAGPNFYIGNNPRADGYTANLPGSRASWLGGFQDWTSMAEQAKGRKLKASEVDRYFFDQAWAFIRSAPRHAFNLSLVKLQLFFYEWEIPNDSDLTSMVGLYAPAFGRIPVRSGAILALGLIGFIMALRDFRRLFPLISFVVLYVASVVAFFVCSRFRLPVMPVAIIFAAVVPVRFIEFLRDRDARSLIGFSILTYVAWVGIHRGVPPPLLSKYAAVTHQRIGVKLGQKGLVGEADEYRKALQINPECSEAETGLGFYYSKNGDAASAIQHFQRAIELNSEMDVYAELGGLLAGQGRWPEAITTVRQGLEHLPGYVDLKRKLAFMLATCPRSDLRNGREAVRLAEEAAAVGQEIPETFDALAAAYAEVDRFEEAVTAANKALAIAQRQGHAPAVEQITAHLRLFRERKPLRQMSEDR